MRYCVLLSLACFLSVSFAAPSVFGLAPFKKAFQEKYIDKSDNEELQAKFKKAGCNTCHIKGESKKKRNSYGEELAKLIDGDANARIKEAGQAGKEARKAETEIILKELDKAFETVANKESKSKVKYGDFLKQGKLPTEDEETEEQKAE